MSATSNQFSLPGGASKKRFPFVRTACATKLLLLLALPAVAQAQWQYAFNNTGGLTITGYTGPGGAVTIPDTINVGRGSQSNYVQVTGIGNPYTGLGSSPFESSGLTNITIGTNVTSIGDWAFYDCTSLIAITVNANNPAYSSLAGVLFDKSQYVLVAFPEGIAGSYTAPNSLICIGDYAFDYCTKLTSITLGTNFSCIGESAFLACANLNAIYFQGDPPSLGTVNPQWVFQGATNVTVYYLPGTTGWGTTFGGRPAVLWNPQVQTSGASFGVRTNQFGFTIAGSSNLVIVVEASTNLANHVWSPVGTNTLTGGSSYFSDPRWTNYHARLYRLRAP